MNCADCSEPVTEADRRNARGCARCRKLLHAECSMSGFDEEDLCEPCHLVREAEYVLDRAADCDFTAKEVKNGALDWWIQLETDA